MTEAPRARAGLAAALAAALAFGVNTPFAPIVAAAGVPAPDLVFWRVQMTLAVVAAIALATRRALPFPRRDLALTLGLALATAGTTIGYVTAATRIPVGVAVIVFYTFPLLVLIVTAVIERRFPGLDRIAVFALAFVGLGIAIGPQLGRYDPLGLALAAGAALCTTGQLFLGNRLTQRIDALALMFWVHVLVLPLAGFASLVTGGPVSPVALAAVPLAVAIHMAGYITGYLLQIRAFRLGRPAAIGLAFTLEPVTSIVTAALVLGERLGPGQYAGGVLVIAAVVASVLLETRRAERSTAT